MNKFIYKVHTAADEHRPNITWVVVAYSEDAAKNICADLTFPNVESVQKIGVVTADVDNEVKTGVVVAEWHFSDPNPEVI